MENTNGHVSPRILAKCKLETPANDWVDMYLYEVSKAYQVNWRPESFLSESKAGETEPDTAAQEQRLLEAELAKVDDADSKDGEGDDDDEAGDLASRMPSAPSSQPHLSNVKNSTTSVPIIKPEGSQDTHKTGNTFELPAAPPSDPAQSERTVLIKSNLGLAPNSPATAGKTDEPTKKSAESTYEVG